MFNKVQILHIPLLLTLAFSSVGTAYAAADPKKSQVFFENAMEELRKQEFSAAMIELRNALQQDPQNLAARIKLGELLLGEDQPLSAIKELETAQEMGGDENLILVPLAKAYMKIAKPAQVITGIVSSGHKPEVDAELKIVQADAYMQLGSEKEAEALYEAVRSMAPIDPRPLLGLAKIQLRKGRREEAEELLSQAVALAPGSFDVLLFKALTERDFGQYEQAIETFSQAIELFPGSVRALTGRAALWMDIGNYEKAKEDIDLASSFNRDSLETIYLRALLLFADGKPEEARASLQESAIEIRAIKDDYRAKLPNTKLMLGVVAFFNKNYDEAVAELRSFLNAQPKHPGAKRYLASAFLARRDWTEIKKLLTPRTGERLVDPFALSILAEAYRATGDYRAAERYYSAALELAPQVADIGIRLAEARLDAGHAEEAVDELETLAEKLPQMMEPRAQLVRVYVRLGALDKAQQTAAALINDFGDEPRAFVVASGVYLAKRDLAEARKLLNRALALEPERLQTRFNLARLSRLEGDLVSAEAQYRAILETHPGATGAQIELCELLVENGDSDELRERVALILEAEPRNIRAHELELKLLMTYSTEVMAIREKLFNFYQAFADDAYVNLVVGRGYRALGQVKDAQLSFQRAVELAQFNTDILHKTAIQQAAIGDWKAVLWTLTKAKQADPNDLPVAMMYATALAQLNDFDSSANEIRRLFEKHGERAELYVLEGDYHMARRDLPEALTSYRKAWDLLPTSKTTNVLVRALRLSGDISGAKQILTPWIARNPTDFTARRHYSEVLLLEKKWEEARVALEKLRQEGVEDLLTLNNLAMVYQRLGDPRALSEAESLYERAPEDAAVLDTYGWILTQNGRAEEGLAILREAYARASTQPVIRYHLAKVLADLGRVEEAEQELEAALESDRQFLDKDAALALLENLSKE